jgi:hypothetical protein
MSLLDRDHSDVMSLVLEVTNKLRHHCLLRITKVPSQCRSHACLAPKILQSQVLDVVYVVSLALQPSAGCGLLVSRDFVITNNDAPHSVGLLWTSNRLVAETST